MPMPTMSPACTASTSNGSSVSSTMCGRPYAAGVAPASTKSHRGVMTPTPNDKWLGLTRWIIVLVRRFLRASWRPPGAGARIPAGRRVARVRLLHADGVVNGREEHVRRRGFGDDGDEPPLERRRDGA